MQVIGKQANLSFDGKQSVLTMIIKEVRSALTEFIFTTRQIQMLVQLNASFFWGRDIHSSQIHRFEPLPRESESEYTSKTAR